MPKARQRFMLISTSSLLVSLLFTPTAAQADTPAILSPTNGAVVLSGFSGPVVVQYPSGGTVYDFAVRCGGGFEYVRTQLDPSGNGGRVETRIPPLGGVDQDLSGQACSIVIADHGTGLRRVESTFTVAAHQSSVKATAAGVRTSAADWCNGYPVTYDLNLPDGTTWWEADVEVTNPAGRVEHNTLYSDGHPVLQSTRDPTSGVVTSSATCPAKAIGKFLIVVKGLYRNDSSSGTINGSATFKVVPARTRATLSVSPRSPRYNAKFTFSGEVGVQSGGSRGVRWRDLEDQPVELQVLQSGKWRPLRSKFKTDHYGFLVRSFRWNLRGTWRFRLHVPSQTWHLSSTSNVITVRTRA